MKHQQCHHASAATTTTITATTTTTKTATTTSRSTTATVAAAVQHRHVHVVPSAIVKKKHTGGSTRPGDGTGDGTGSTLSVLVRSRATRNVVQTSKLAGEKQQSFKGRPVTPRHFVQRLAVSKYEPVVPVRQRQVQSSHVKSSQASLILLPPPSAHESPNVLAISVGAAVVARASSARAQQSSRVSLARPGQSEDRLAAESQATAHTGAVRAGCFFVDPLFAPSTSVCTSDVIQYRAEYGHKASRRQGMQERTICDAVLKRTTT